MKTLIIAEAGVNHNGDLQRAREMVRVAADAGADFVKFQTFTANELATANAPKADYQHAGTQAEESQLAMLRQLELSLDDHKILAEDCANAGIAFLSTGFDTASIDLLLEFDPRFIKVPSGEITNLPLLRHIGGKRLPVIFSTGMCTLGEIEDAIYALEEAGVDRDAMTILHCNTEYPTPFADVNLRAMHTIGNSFGLPFGYSDHTLGIEVSIAAVALGATIIEKHFTLDRNLPGPDHAASLEPDELRAMVSAIRNIELAMAGSGIKRPSASELKNRQIARRSIVAKEVISAGSLFTGQNLTVKRPGTGISPMEWDRILGRTADRDYAIDDPIAS
jgi:N,N'-diacetyllegionaminate synthase